MSLESNQEKSTELFTSCLKKQENLKKLFSTCKNKEEVYQEIIKLGRMQKKIAEEEKTEPNLVPGCQSQMFLVATYKDGLLHFRTESDALISAGLGQILVCIYDQEKPEVILGCAPACIQELGIIQSLTPGRANGLASIYTSMKQHALKWLIHSR